MCNILPNCTLSGTHSSFKRQVSIIMILSRVVNALLKILLNSGQIYFSLLSKFDDCCQRSNDGPVKCSQLVKTHHRLHQWPKAALRRSGLPQMPGDETQIVLTAQSSEFHLNNSN